MNVSREEAAEALADIDRAGGKMNRLQSYRSSAIFFIIWGLVWFCANLGAHFYPEQGNLVWLGAIILGSIASTIASVAISRRASTDSADPERDAAIGARMGRRMGATAVIMFGFIFCIGQIMQPNTSDQYNALISILFAFIYMAMGVWLGWRLFAIGFVTAAAILTGFYFFREIFDLWMAFAAGGALIAAGLWLRSA